MTHTALLGSAAAKASHQIFEVTTADRSAGGFEFPTTLTARGKVDNTTNGRPTGARLTCAAALFSIMVSS
jgi:hypothetical protein